jgi:hypothetical protein
VESDGTLAGYAPHLDDRLPLSFALLPKKYVAPVTPQNLARQIDAYADMIVSYSNRSATGLRISESDKCGSVI